MALDIVGRTKRCPRCTLTKSWDEFYIVAKSGIPGAYCKPCSGKKAQELHKKHIDSNDCTCKRCESERNYAKGLKWCPRGEHLVSFAEFGKNKKGEHGLGPYCKACMNDYAVKRRAHEPNCECKGCTVKKVAENGLRICARCNEALSIDFFYRYPKGHYSSYCGDCIIVRRIESRLSGRCSRYSITTDEFMKMYESQGGACASCGDGHEAEDLEIDHDHECCHREGGGSCGQCVRALLCLRCNRALGMVNDDVDRIMGMAIYIMKFKTVLTLNE